MEELHETLSTRSYRKWARYWYEEPWGVWRDNAHAGQIAAMIANVNRDPTKKPDAYSFADFMLVDPELARANETARSLAGLRAMAKPKKKSDKKARKSGKRKKAK